jgi:hypothetical protein
METQRREALQQELQDIARERTEEASAGQLRQQQYDRKVSELESTISRLQASLRTIQSGHGNISGNAIAATKAVGEVSLMGQMTQETDSSLATQQLTLQLEDAKREISKLSEQLLRHQGLAENAKTEILALKGRLQAAVTRAEEAEKVQYAYSQTSMGGTSVNRMYDMESGGGGGGGVNNIAQSTHAFSTRRRIKGARSGSVRSIRSALRLGSGRGTNSAMDQFGMTIDAVDSFMVDTGSFMRTEPLARLGFLLYLLTLHVWSFALVVFHTTEVEHGDFGSMDSNPRHWREHEHS